MRTICSPACDNLTSNVTGSSKRFCRLWEIFLGVSLMSFLLKCKVHNTELFLGMKPGGQNLSHIERQISSLGKEKNETFGSLRFEIQLIALQREGI